MNQEFRKIVDEHLTAIMDACQDNNDLEDTEMEAAIWYVCLLLSKVLEDDKLVRR